VLAERSAGADGSAALLAAAEKAAKENRKLFGLFGGKGGNFEPPVPSDVPGTPTIIRGSIENPTFADAVTAALKVLSRDRDGFFLMAEQGDIDWANHADDYRWMVGTVHDLNEGVKAAIAFVDRPGDDIDWDNTLILVTSDHGNSYMRLNDAKPLATGDLPAQVAVNGTQTYPDGEVTYGSGSHTNELVSLYARGSGAGIFRKFEGTWYPGTGIIDNTHIYKAMRAATLGPARAGEAGERE
jgi:alkaline phosphatase